MEIHQFTMEPEVANHLAGVVAGLSQEYDSSC
jgi:phage shock protein PspC (stress-responsive transcriptional regulator)